MLVENSMEKIVALAKGRGFVYAGSEIYGGLANTWDYGPLGVELKNNIKKAWWKKFIQERKNSFGIDAGILMNPNVWVASGHVSGFNDPLMDCRECKTRHRADNLVADFDPSINPDSLTIEQLKTFIDENKIPCPNCKKHNFTNIRQFNLMFKTFRGVTEDSSSEIFLRPETAQGQFVNFLNVQRSMRAKVPFGVGQIGKAFRNEITPGNFTFRTIEFEQMEYQMFCKEGQDEDLYEYFKQFALEFFANLGIKESKLKFKDHEKLAHYAKSACDIEYEFPFGWGEINGTHNRTNFDLTQHQEHSKKSMLYLDPMTNEKYIPFVIESTVGADRAALVFLCDAYDEEEVGEGDVRTVLRLHPTIAPVKVAIFPLSKKLNDGANEIFEKLSKKYVCEYDEIGSIGKRYRRQDEIGTPCCITFDFDSLEDNSVTVRDRDTMQQVRIKVEELEKYFEEKFGF